MTSKAKITWVAANSTPVTTEKWLKLRCVEDGRECYRMIHWFKGHPQCRGAGYSTPFDDGVKIVEASEFND